MSELPAHICRVAVDIVLDLLFPLLLTVAGSKEAACRAAIEMLAEYQPETAEELGLAAEIIAFRHKALTAMRDATRAEAAGNPALPLLKVANGLRRSQASAQRKLDALQRARRAPAKKPAAQAHAARSSADPAPATPAPPAAQPDETPVQAAPATRAPGSLKIPTPPTRRPAPPAIPAPVQPRPSLMDAMVRRVAADIAAPGPNRQRIDDALENMVASYKTSLMRNLIDTPATAGVFA